MNFFKTLKKFFKEKNGKVILENFLSLSSLQIVNIILPLITLPYVLRIIGLDNYGIIALALALTAYFQSLTDFSFMITATRDVSIFKNSPEKLNIIFSKVIIIKSLFFLVSLLIIYLIVFLYPPFYENRLIFILTSSMLFGQILFPEWFFQGVEKMKFISILNVAIRVFFTINIFIFITQKDDFWIYPLLNSLGYIGAGIAGQYIVISKFKVKFRWIKVRYIKQTIVSNYPIFINQFFPTLYNNTSSFLLGIISGTYLVGLYTAIKKIVDLSISLLSIVSRVFYPFLNRNRFFFPNYKKLMLVISSFLVVIILISNKLIFWFLDINDENEFSILLILVIGIIGYTLYDIFGLNYFIIKRQDKLVMKNTIRSSLIGFITAFPLIYFFGILGAAMNLTLSRFLMGGILFFKWKNDQ